MTSTRSTHTPKNLISISQFAYQWLSSGKTQDETFELVKSAFPESKTSKACIAWYASKLKTGKATIHKPVDFDAEFAAVFAQID